MIVTAAVQHLLTNWAPDLTNTREQPRCVRLVGDHLNKPKHQVHALGFHPFVHHVAWTALRKIFTEGKEDLFLYFCGSALEGESGVSTAYNQTKCSRTVRANLGPGSALAAVHLLGVSLYEVRPCWLHWSVELLRGCGFITFFGFEHLSSDGAKELWRFASSIHVTEVQRFSLEFFFSYKQNSLPLALVRLPDNHEFFTADSLPTFFFPPKAQTVIIKPLAFLLLLFVFFFFQPVKIFLMSFKCVFF